MTPTKPNVAEHAHAGLFLVVQFRRYVASSEGTPRRAAGAATNPSTFERTVTVDAVLGHLQQLETIAFAS
jgi:hypothetical protein